MEVRIIHASVVVLANTHNPSILNPTFLKSEGIIDDDWSVEGNAFCTPPLAQVVYTNGIQILAETNKLQVIDRRPPKDVGKSLAPEIAAKYVKRLPHTPYSAVGLNVKAYLTASSPQESLIQKFVKEGPWNKSKLSLQAAEFQFSYPVPSAKLNLKFKAGIVDEEDGGEISPAIIIEANYNTDLNLDKKVAGQVTRTIMKFDKRCAHLMKTLGVIFEQGV